MAPFAIPPVVQAGMGGGLAGGRLAGAVSGAGGLGTIGHDAPERMAAQLRDARSLTDRPVAANVLLPLVRPAHFAAAAAADVVVTFWGKPVRPPGARQWWHQCGSVEEARAAAEAGADAVIAQGLEAGGHIRGRTPALELLVATRESVAVPVLVAGGIAERADVERALAAGAAGAVAGTRFLLSDESGAHAEYKRRLCAASATVLTELFGMGWPNAPQRVVPNAAVNRWGHGPRWALAANRVTAPVLTRLPDRMQIRAAASQRPGIPLLSPLAPTVGGPENLLESGALYAGQTVARIAEVRPAAEIVRALTPD
jgi:NAD(P)H-dependent flavin oxidoreductase YrpB (nitropropane dioxygenase family)